MTDKTNPPNPPNPPSSSNPLAAMLSKAKPANTLANAMKNPPVPAHAAGLPIVPSAAAPKRSGAQPQTSVIAWEELESAFSASELTTDEGTFREQLNGYLQEIETSLDVPDIGNAMRRCMIFIQNNPDMKHLLLPDDVHLLVRALKSSSNIVFNASVSRETKSTNSKKLASKVADIMGDFSFD